MVGDNSKIKKVERRIIEILDEDAYGNLPDITELETSGWIVEKIATVIKTNHVYRNENHENHNTESLHYYHMRKLL